MRAWLDADRDSFRTHRKLTEAAEEWQRSFCDSQPAGDASLLFHGNRWTAIAEWATKHVDDLNATTRMPLSQLAVVPNINVEMWSESESGF